MAQIHFGKSVTARGKSYAERYRWTDAEKRQILQELRTDPELSPPAAPGFQASPDIEASPDSFGQMGIYDTGFPSLDHLTLGFDPGEYAVLGAGTGVGKTQIALYIATHLAAQEIPVLYISRELSNPEIKSRYQHVREFQGNRPDYQNFIMPDTHRLDAAKLTDQIRAFKDQYCGMDLGFVIVDHLHAFCRGRDLTERLGELSGALRETAQDLKLPILALSQLNREKYLDDEGPMNYHLKESGYLEEDAYTIMMTWRNQNGTNIKLTKSRRRDLSDLESNVITLRSSNGKLS